MTTFIRVIKDDQKANSLLDKINSIKQGKVHSGVFTLEPTSFSKVPGSPFAYWVSESIRDLFANLSKFESIEKNKSTGQTTFQRTAKTGLSSGDDFRFVRTWWEVPPHSIVDGNEFSTTSNWSELEQVKEFVQWCRDSTNTNKRWIHFAKGGEFSPYYADLHLVVDWNKEGKEICNLFNLKSRKILSRPQNISFYFLKGITWSRRTSSKISTRFLPYGAIFSDKGPTAFCESLFICVINSSLIHFIISVSTSAEDEAARSYEVGIISKIPIPKNISQKHSTQLHKLSSQIIALKQSLDTCKETSHLFYKPAVLQFLKPSLKESIHDYNFYQNECSTKIDSYQKEIDEIVYDLYKISDEDKKIIEELDNENALVEESDDGDEDFSYEKGNLSMNLFSYMVGIAFQRWNLQFALDNSLKFDLPDPFAPLPAFAPSALKSGNGFSILTDDIGHEKDLENQIKVTLDNIYKEHADTIEHELCELLEVKSLRDYLKKPMGFFDSHLKQYSKSRRSAPIYLPLSTPSNSYTVWIYYHRLSDETLYTIVNDFVEPKIRSVLDDTKTLQKKENRNQSEAKELDKCLELHQELLDFREELLRVAKLPYKPNLNDGVVITLCPLWKLFTHTKWKNTLKDTFQKLEKGVYDWSHLALSIWTERVKEKCKKDKSIAIAHDLENLYEKVDNKKKKK